jgi:hypothetical protein
VFLMGRTREACRSGDRAKITDLVEFHVSPWLDSNN